MKVLIIQNHQAENLGTFEAYLQARNINHFVHNAFTNKVFPDLADYDAVLVGGTPISIYAPTKPSWLNVEIARLADALKTNKPYLGICGGGQILASILGAEVKRNPVKEVGSYEVTLTNLGQTSPFFKGFPTEIPVFQFHGDTFDVPHCAELLVEGKECKNQAFGKGKALAVQFHLEVSSKTAGLWADEYKQWLGGFGKSKAQIVEECQSIEKQTRILSETLMDNFLRVAKS